MFAKAVHSSKLRHVLTLFICGNMSFIRKTYSRLNLCSTSLSYHPNSGPKSLPLFFMMSLWRHWPLSVCHTLLLYDSHLITQAAGYQGLILESLYCDVFISSYQFEVCTFLPKVFMVARSSSCPCGHWRLLIPESSGTAVELSFK